MDSRRKRNWWIAILDGLGRGESSIMGSGNLIGMGRCQNKAETHMGVGVQQSNCEAAAAEGEHKGRFWQGQAVSRW